MDAAWFTRKGRIGVGVEPHLDGSLARERRESRLLQHTLHRVGAEGEAATPERLSERRPRQHGQHSHDGHNRQEFHEAESAPETPQLVWLMLHFAPLIGTSVEKTR